MEIGALGHVLGRVTDSVAPHPVDHEVTKSLYFADSDGNGVEQYIDASDVWRREPQRVAYAAPMGS
ncbi:MAG TPA: hypothetical protein VG274_05905 [Rhizomicrobium sp.]|nr:hypothetical protein [Rhizomicrobium sp.]